MKDFLLSVFHVEALRFLCCYPIFGDVCKPVLRSVVRFGINTSILIVQEALYAYPI